MYIDSDEDESYGYCNSCGEEWNGDEDGWADCPNPDCDGNGEWVHADEYTPQPGETPL